ncbi:pyruvate decarboxylase [Clavulina sp. PMI_390]|nr:pyruvate decarboxylase [Clavulina sp. PMI_390]
MSQPQKSYPAQISVGDYILERLSQLGVTSLFGVPGDFNLAFLDLVEAHPSIKWVGNANELNAAYAMDGNARVKRSLAAMVTTFGVGELSALNGVAGCYSERIPALHLVGVPSISLQEGHALLHHTLGDGNFHAFEHMSGHITCKSTFLTEAENAGKLIDETLIAALTECRPVYLTLPTNLVHPLISSAPLLTPLPPSSSSPHPALLSSAPLPAPKDPEALAAAVEAITQLYASAKNPVVLIDAIAERLGVEDLVMELVEATGMMVFTSPMGKGTVDERHPQFAGIYIGSITVPSVQALMDTADLVIDVGPLKSDFNTGSFSYSLKSSQTVELHISHVTAGYAHYPDVGLRSILTALKDTLSALPKKLHSQATAASLTHATEDRRLANAITHAYLWPRLSSFFKEGDVIVGETGTSEFGILDTTLPKGVSLLLQVLWGSIGWSVPATLGAAFAAREQGRRTILFVGDGSLQLTVQEIGTMINHGLKPILFVLNNDGYEIERQINGPRAQYNQIARWNHQAILSLFSPAPDANTYPSNALPVDVAALRTHKSYRVSSQSELDQLLNDEQFGKAECIQLVELVMPRDDAPRALLTQAKLSAKANQG